VFGLHLHRHENIHAVAESAQPESGMMALSDASTSPTDLSAEGMRFADSVAIDLDRLSDKHASVLRGLQHTQ
jgi:hypothetical protein